MDELPTSEAQSLTPAPLNRPDNVLQGPFEVGQKAQGDEADAASKQRLRNIVNWLVVSGTCAFALSFLALITRWSWGRHSWIQDIVKAHFAAAVGLPLAAIASLVIVVLLESRFDTVEMEAFHGFIRFKGASGPIVLWAFCFLGITGSIRLLW
jgi:hypothetical protein